MTCTLYLVCLYLQPIRAYLTAGSPARQNALLCTAVGILGILLRNERDGTRKRRRRVVVTQRYNNNNSNMVLETLFAF